MDFVEDWDMWAGIGGGMSLLVGLVCGLCALMFLMWMWRRWVYGVRQLSLAGRHVVITGGSSGIGLEIARGCVRKGASVTLVARGKARLEAAQVELQKELAAHSKQFVGIESIDVADSSAVRQTFIKVEARAPIDVLVANAGICEPLTLLELEDRMLRSMMDVNYFGVAHCVRAVLPSMIQRRLGRILVVSSGAALLGVYGYTGYAASKFALRGFVESLRYETLAHNVQIGICFPPDTDTPQLAYENERKHEETRLFGGGGLMKASEVANAAIRGIENGSYLVAPNLDMWLLSRLTCGSGPPDSILAFLFDIFFLGIVRAVFAVFYIPKWQASIRRKQSQ